MFYVALINIIQNYVIKYKWHLSWGHMYLMKCWCDAFAIPHLKTFYIMMQFQMRLIL